MSWINLGEVSYVLSPRAGRKRSIEVAAQLRAGLDLDPATPERILHASAIKAQHRMSYADAFAVATALAHDAVLVTGDPEILAAGSVQQTEDVRRR